MAQNYGPRIVQDGLVMCLDPSQNKSYPTTDLPVKNGLVMWMDAADDTTFSYSSGTTVSQWRDKSPSGYHMTPVAGSPTRNAFQNSRKVVAFTTAQDIQNGSIDLRTSPYTVFIVSRYTSPSAGTGRILTSNGGYNNWLLGHWASETNKYYANGWVYQTYAAIDTNWKLYLGDWGGSSNNIANFYAAGTALATNSTAATAGPWTLGINANSGERSNCEAAEIIVFNRLLSAVERRLVHTYLGQKWGISNTDRSVIDLSGNDDSGLLGDGTAANMPVYDYYNKGFKFDGSSDYLRVGANSSLQTNNVTVGIFFKTTNNGQSVQFMGGYGDTGNYGYWIGIVSTNLVFKVGNGSTGYQLASGITPNNDQIYYAVGTYDGVTQKIYVDGVLKATSTTVTGNMSYTGMTDGFLLGQVQGFTAGRYMTGNIYYAHVYNRALNAAEVSQNFESLKNRFTNTIVQNGLVLNLDAGNPFSYAGAGTTWFDVSGNSYNSTLTNSPIYSRDNAGVLSFNGSNQYSDCGNVLASLTNLTIECFVKFGTQSALYGGVVSKTLSNADGWEIRVDAYTSTTTTLLFRYVGDNAGTGFNTNFTNGVWYHIVATGTSGSQKTYVNGVQVGSTTTALSPSANTNSLVIGKLTYSSLYVNMVMGFARIYNRALSAAEVLQNYNATKGRFGL